MDNYFQIDLLKNHPKKIDSLVQIWHQVLESKWIPDADLKKVKAEYHEHLNENFMPLTYVALFENQAVGMGSLRPNDGLQNDLGPWLGSLVVTPEFQNRKVGVMLIDAIKKKAKHLGFETLYLFTIDPTIPNYYQKLGWEPVSKDLFHHHPVTIMKIRLY